MQGSSSSSHNNPVKPKGHMQVNPNVRSTQVALFWQSSKPQSSMSTEQLLPVYPPKHSQVKVSFPSTHIAVPTGSHVACKQKSMSSSQKSPSQPVKHSHKNPSIVLAQVPLLQSTTSQGDTSGDGDTMTTEVVNGDSMAMEVVNGDSMTTEVVNGTIIVMSMSVAVGTTKKSVSEMLISGEDWTKVVKGTIVAGEEVKGMRRSSEVLS